MNETPSHAVNWFDQIFVSLGVELLLILSVVLVVIGLAGTVLPALPGTTLVLFGLILAAYTKNFERVGWGTIAVLAGLTALSFAVDFAATMLGAKRVGASKLALIGAALGTLGGLALGIVGVFIGPFVGAVAGELLHRKTRSNQTTREALAPAGKVGLGAWLGLMLGTVAKLIIVGLMIGVFLLVWFNSKI